MSEPESLVASCVNICALDEADICTGCQRSVEITRWSRMTNPERREVLALCNERAASSGAAAGQCVMLLESLPQAAKGSHPVDLTSAWALCSLRQRLHSCD